MSVQFGIRIIVDCNPTMLTPLQRMPTCGKNQHVLVGVLCPQPLSHLPHHAKMSRSNYVTDPNPIE